MATVTREFNAVHLSVDNTCNTKKAIVVQDDGRAGKQYWTFDLVDGSTNEYYIHVTEGTDCTTKLLSARQSCFNDDVYVTESDDGTGLQRWKAQPIEGKTNTFSFQIVNGRFCTSRRNYLSTTNKGSILKLWRNADDARQHWELSDIPTYENEAPVTLPATSSEVTVPEGKLNTSIFLSSADDCTRNNAKTLEEDNAEWSHDWEFVLVDG